MPCISVSQSHLSHKYAEMQKTQQLQGLDIRDQHSADAYSSHYQLVLVCRKDHSPRHSRPRNRTEDEDKTDSL